MTGTRVMVGISLDRREVTVGNRVFRDVAHSMVTCGENGVFTSKHIGGLGNGC